MPEHLDPKERKKRDAARALVNRTREEPIALRDIGKRFEEITEEKRKAAQAALANVKSMAKSGELKDVELTDDHGELTPAALKLLEKKKKEKD